MRRERPVTYPELVLGGPADRVLSALRLGSDPADAHEMAQRVNTLSTLTLDKLGVRRPDEQVHLDAYLYWALHRWERSGCPTFTMEGELAWAIAHTEPPMTTFDLLPEVPVDGMYVSMPPVFDIGDDTTGRHRIEGFFLTVNEIYVPTDGNSASGPIVAVRPSEESKFAVRRSVTVVGIGEDKSPELAERIERGEGWHRDDWVVYFSLVPGEPIYFQDGVQGVACAGVAELTRVVANFLYLLQNTNELTEGSDPVRPEFVGTDRKTRRERERQQRKGRSVHPHRVWTLSTLAHGKVLPDPDAPVTNNPGRRVSGHVVLGHIHRYWVVDPAGRPSMGTREVVTRTMGTRTYHLVAKWLLPYVRGEGPIATARVLVR